MEKGVDSILKFYKKHMDIDEDQQAILAYAIQLLMSTVLSYIMTLAVGWVLGIFWYVAIITFITSVLRFYAGGAHSESMLGCAMAGTIAINGLGWVSKSVVLLPNEVLTLSLGIFLFALMSIKKYAPADTPQKPITSLKKKNRLQKRSFLMVLIWFFMITGWYVYSKQTNGMILASGLGIFCECFSITPIGYQMLHCFDKIFEKVWKKE